MQDRKDADPGYLVPGTIPTSQILTKHYISNQSTARRLGNPATGLRDPQLLPRHSVTSSLRSFYHE